MFRVDCGDDGESEDRPRVGSLCGRVVGRH